MKDDLFLSLLWAVQAILGRQWLLQGIVRNREGLTKLNLFLEHNSNNSIIKRGNTSLQNSVP